jgi:hypothetical protein
LENDDTDSKTESSDDYEVEDVDDDCFPFGNKRANDKEEITIIRNV